MATVLDYAYQRQVNEVRRITSVRVAETFASLDDWRDEALFIERAVPIVRSGGRTAVALTDAYLARKMGTSPVGLDADVVLSGLRNGVSPAEVYARPFHQMWTELGNGKPFPDVLNATITRSAVLADTDVGLAARDSAVEWAKESNAEVYGWERVTDGDACDLCVIASTQRYWTDQLMPIHDRCHCTVAPLTQPTGQVLWEKVNQSSSIETDEGSSTSVEEHGELGPVLVSPEHDFRGPADVAADTND